MGSGRHAGPPVLLDPFAADPPLHTQGIGRGQNAHQGDGAGQSVFSGPLAPEHSAWLAAGEPDGTLRAETRTIAGFEVPVHLSVPSTSRPQGLLVLFDGSDWFDSLAAPRACEAAGLPPMVVIGIGAGAHAGSQGSASAREQRVATLGGNSEFLSEVCATLLPQIEAELREQGIALPGRSRRIVCGQSLGGLSALLLALESPATFGTVLAHSASLWWRPGGQASPADLGRADADDWLVGRLLDSGDLDIEVHLAVGSREVLMVVHHRLLAQVLEERGELTSLSIYQGGHDLACWRGELIDGLRAVFGTSSATES